jgi:AcrR family transcriptional regulator
MRCRHNHGTKVLSTNVDALNAPEDNMKHQNEAETSGVMETASARDLILQAAVELFALNGFQATTVRQISELARQNVAAINYYFGSKDVLVREVIVSVFKPVNESRVLILKDVKRQYAPHAPPIKAVVEALVRPLVECQRTRDGGRAAIRLQMHLRATPSHPYYLFLQKQFNYAARPYIDLLCQLLPHNSRSELIWRYEMVRGAAMHILSNCDPLSDKLNILSEGAGIGDVNDDRAVLAEIVAFCTPGITAPPMAL